MKWNRVSRLLGGTLATIVAVVVVFAAVSVVSATRSEGEPAGHGAGHGGTSQGGDADVGFLQDMIDHHEQADLMSGIALRGKASRQVRNLALDVIAYQRYEIGMMEGWLIEWGLERGLPGREAMVWMGTPVEVERMPGMATMKELSELSRLSGHKLDLQFLELMRAHHVGGVHMAEAAAEMARNPHVRWLAKQMVHNQQREIADIDRLLPN